MTFKPNHFACWFEIPVTDLEASRDFYSEVFDMDLKIEDGGPNDLVMFPVGDEAGGVSGHLYPGTPSENGPTIHLVVPDSLEAARPRVEAAGGKPANVLDGKSFVPVLKGQTNTHKQTHRGCLCCWLRPVRVWVCVHVGVWLCVPVSAPLSACFPLLVCWRDLSGVTV